MIKPVVDPKEELDHICRVHKLKADAVSIDMTYKHLGDAGAIDIARFIEISKTIRKVILSKHQIRKRYEVYYRE